MTVGRRAVPAAPIALGAVLGAVALAGCGGSGPAAETSPLLSATPVASLAVAHTVPSHTPRRTRAATHHHRRRPRPKPSFSPVASGNAGALSALAASVSGPASAPAVASSPAAFVASADAICSGYRRSVRATGAGAVTLVAQENELSTLVSQTATALKRLQALGPPSGEDPLVSRFIALTRTSVGDFVRAQARSSSTSESVGNATQARDMALAESSAKAALRADAAARKLGLHVCGSEGAEWL